MKVPGRIDHKVDSPVAFQGESHFGNTNRRSTGRGPWFQAFESANFADRVRCDRELEAAHGKQNHRFVCSLALWLTLSHSAPTLAAPKMYSTRFSMAL